MKRFIIVNYCLTLILIVIYSYSQIDLNLTLSGNYFYQLFQKSLIQLGYYNRPLSTVVYLVLLFSLFISYFILIKLIKNKQISKTEIIRLVIFSGIILILAYSAFSYDLFNYIFDARIITKYGLNPYQYKALDFSNDLWTRFMHWTHRTYPYGPIWLLITLPFSFLGMQKFTLTLFLFKTLFLACYWLSCYFIYAISSLKKQTDSLLSLAFFAFNPLILIESLVSPHNDSLMLTFALISIYLLISNKFFRSFISMVLSLGIKFITAPILLINLYYFFKRKKSIQFPNLVFIIWLIYLVSAFVEIYLKEVLPWYAIPLIGFSALIITNKFVLIFSTVISFGLLLKYVPFLYFGEWFVSSYNLYLTILVILIVMIFFYYFIDKKRSIIKSRI